MKKVRKAVCLLDKVEEKEIDGKLIKIALFTRAASEERPQFSNATIWGKFTYTRNGYHQLETTIQDNSETSCSRAIRQASEKFISDLKARYVGSNVNIDHIMAFVEPTIKSWLEKI
jgi:hypothetical protein